MRQNDNARIAGRASPLRVFVVEDEGLVLLDLTLTLEDLGYEIAGAASEVTHAVKLASELNIDVALLDVNLCGTHSGPVADVLDKRGIPFLFATGYTQATLPDGHAARPILAKPYTRDMLQRAINRLQFRSQSKAST